MIDAQREARQGVCPQVVLHGFSPEGADTNEFGLSNIDGPTNVTQYVTSLSWTHATRAPYESIQMELVFPGSVFQAIMPGIPLRPGTRAPATGFWVVLYLPNEDENAAPIWTAVHWGYATQLRIRSSVDANGTQAVRLSVTCDSWVGLLRRNTVFLAAGSNYVREGSSYDLRGWSESMSTLMRGSLNKPPGESFSKLFHLMAVQLLPNTLASGLGEYMDWSADRKARVPFGDGMAENSSPSKCYLFRDVIRVIWNRELCAKHAPMRVLQHKEVAGQGLGTVGAAMARGTTWSYLESTFFPSPHLECFPSLEWPVLSGVTPLERRTASDSEEAAAAYATQGGEGGGLYYQLPLRDAVNNGEVAVDWTIDVVAPFNGDLDDVEFPLGRALGGANPVLIYRMRPTLFSAINASAGAQYTRDFYQAAETDQGYAVYLSAPSASERVGVNQATQVVSAYENSSSSHWYTWLANEVYDVTWHYSEDSRTNMVFARTPYRVQSQLETHGLLGEPLVNNADVAKHGLRLRTVEWPFFPPDGVEQSTASLADQLTALNEELWMDIASHDHGVFFGQGMVRGVFKPWIKAGHYVRVHWGEYADQGTTRAWSPFVHHPQDEAASPEEEEYPGFVGYVTSVTHSVQVSPQGAVTASTAMQLERVTLLGAETIAFNYPPHSPQQAGWVPIVVDPETGEQVRGKVEVDEDGNITFIPVGS